MGNTNSNVANQISDINFHIFDNLQEEVVIYEIMRDMLDEIADLRVNYINSASLISEIMPSEEVIGKTVTELYDEDVAALHLKIAGKVLKSGEGKKYEVYLEPTDKYYSVSGYSPDDNMYIMISTDISELKKAGKTLQGRKELYKEFFNNPLNGFALCEIITDDKGEPVDFVYLKVNNAFEDFTGLKREDVLNKKVTEVRPIEEIAPAIEIYGKVALTGKSEQFEITFPSLDKTYDIIAFSPQKMRFIAMFTDITEQKKIEEELKKQADLLDLTRDAIIVRDMGDRVIFWNKGAEERYGWTREEAYGKVTYNLLKTEFLDSSNRIFNQLYQKGHWEGELIQTRRDGKKIIVSSRWALQKNENNEPVGFMEINTDITEHKKADESLKESEKKFRKVFNNANDALFLHKLKENGMPGRFIEVNNVACQRLGYTRNEFLKMSPEDIDDPKEAIILPSIMEELYEKSNVTFEMVHVSKNGVKIPVEISAHIFTLNGEKVVLSIVRDITERKKTEKALKEARDNLEEQVEERTVELEEAYEALTESEEKFREIFNNANDMIALAERSEENLPGKYIEVNKIATLRLGYSRDEFLNMTPADIIAPERRVEMRKNAAELVKNGHAEFEIVHVTRDGKRIPVEVNTHLFKLKGKEVMLAISRDITERKEAEKAIKDSEKQLRMITDNMTDLVSQADINGIFQYVSPSHKLILGYDPEDLLGKSVYDLIHPDDLERVKEAARKAFITGKPDKIEVRFKHSDGHYVWLEIAGNTLFDENHLIKGAIFGARDINERKKAEEQIKRQYSVLNGINRIFREALTSETEEEVAEVCLSVAEELTGSEIGFIGEVNANGRLEGVALSLSAWKSYKAPPSEVRKLVTNMRIVSFFGRVVKEGKSQIVNNPGSDPDKVGVPNGHPAIKSFLGVPLKQGDKTTGLIALANKKGVYVPEDVETVESLSIVIVEALMNFRARNELEEYKNQLEELVRKLRESETQFRTLTENSPDLIIRVDKELKYVYMSPTVTNILGKPPEFFIGKSIEETGNPEESVELWKKDYWKVFNTGEIQYSEYEFPTVNGLKTFRRTTVPEYNDNGKIVTALSIVRDVTKRKQAEEKLKETIEELKRSNDELQRFAYVTSHDLQEPLRTIASFTQLLERRYKGKLDSDADEFMDYIVEASIRMKQMIQDLLDYSRVATKGGELKPVSSEIVLNHVLNSLRATITENNAEITHDSLPEVVADENQLTRVFLNLIANAIKFKKEDEPPKIHISSRKDEENKEYVFEVADNGIGIEEQYFDRIFTIFQRLHTRDEYQGTGIGLSIVRKIIERHEGHIWVESKPGEGSVFYFTISY